MIGFDYKPKDPAAYLVGNIPVNKLQNIDGKTSVASPYWKGSLAYA